MAATIDIKGFLTDSRLRAQFDADSSGKIAAENIFLAMQKLGDPSILCRFKSKSYRKALEVGLHLIRLLRGKTIKDALYTRLIPTHEELAGNLIVKLDFGQEFFLLFSG